jgi:hypothetical protein
MCTESADKLIWRCLTPAIMHRTDIQSSMSSCKDAFPPENRKCCTDDRRKLCIFPEAAAHLLTRCRVDGPLPRSRFPAVGVVRASSVKIAYVKPHASIWIRSLIARSCKSGCMQCGRSNSPLKRVFLLAVVHARARASEHACVQQCVSVLMLLLKFVSMQTSVQKYECSILTLYPLGSE